MNDETKTEPTSETTEAARANGAAGELEPAADLRDEEIAKLKEEAGGLKDQLLRALADLDNLRKRSERERAEATLYAATSFARDMSGRITRPCSRPGRAVSWMKRGRAKTLSGISSRCTEWPASARRVTGLGAASGVASRSSETSSANSQ